MTNQPAPSTDSRPAATYADNPAARALFTGRGVGDAPSAGGEATGVRSESAAGLCEKRRAGEAGG